MIICHNTIFATLQKKEKRRRRFDNNNNNVSSLIIPQKQSGRVSYIVYNPLLPLCNSHSFFYYEQRKVDVFIDT
jgi:hypothetical protein